MVFFPLAFIFVIVVRLIVAHSCSNFCLNSLIAVFFFLLFFFFFSPKCHLVLSCCQHPINRSRNQLVRPYNQGGIQPLPVCILYISLYKDAWLCHRAVKVSPLFRCVDGKRLQICQGWLPRLLCTTWATMSCMVHLCRRVHGLSILKAGSIPCTTGYVKKKHRCGGLL